MIILLSAALGQAGVSDDWIRRATERARPVATCEVGPDCDAKFARSREWVQANTRFAIARETDSLIVTYGAVYANTDPSLLVVFDPPENGVRAVRFRAWCGNFISCMPSPRSLQRLFRQAMDDTHP